MKEAFVRSLSAFWVNLRKGRSALVEVPYFLKTLTDYRAQAAGSTLQFRLKDLFPVLTDRLDASGSGSGHYFHQDLWAARKIFKGRPERHIDIGSRVDGFVAHLLTFMPVVQVDIRPLKSNIPGLTFIQDDATLMESIPDGSVDSLSSLHVVEHFGLGRYGDPVDPEAWKRAIRSFVRVLRPCGRLYLSLPVGKERLEFNAHRILSPDSVLEACIGSRLVSFTAVLDDGSFADGITPRDVRDCRFACCLFELTK